MRSSLSALLLGVASVALAEHHGSSHAAAHLKRANHEQRSTWDYVVKGSDVASSLKIRSSADDESDATPMSDFTLRAKKVDPASLKVDTVKQLSGYLDNDATDKHLFYWFFESRNDPENDPVILWLNGGPGASSLIGLFDGPGPAKVTSDLELVNNPHSWNSNASVIFMDQPVNTGFSYSKTNATASSLAAADDLYALLTLFFFQFPQYTKQDFHIAGQSYAGHYIPSTASRILAEKNRNINLKSILIGNGLTDFSIQYASYVPFGCGEANFPAIFNSSTCKMMEDAVAPCQDLMQQCYENENQGTACKDGSRMCQRELFDPFRETGLDNYDLRKNLTKPTDYFAKWLDTTDVRDALGVEVESYKSVNPDVLGLFWAGADHAKPIYKLVPGILKEIPVLVYAGDTDYICNWLGNQQWTKALEWPGKEAFNQAEEHGLRVANGKEDYGRLTAAKDFAFLRIFAAGHSVPADQPVAALDMVNRWVRGEWWDARA